jgi:hypothetical protein
MSFYWMFLSITLCPILNLILSLAFFRVAMDFIEEIGVGQERAEAGFGAEVDRPASILNARKIGRVRIAEFSAT